jgi:hypothetical protein
MRVVMVVSSPFPYTPEGEKQVNHEESGLGEVATAVVDYGEGEIGRGPDIETIDRLIRIEDCSGQTGEDEKPAEEARTGERGF